MRPSEAFLDPFGQVADDLPVRARLSARRNSLAHALDTPVRVGEGAVFFREGGCRQENIGKSARFIDKLILGYQKFQLLHLLAGVVQIWL